MTDSSDLFPVANFLAAPRRGASFIARWSRRGERPDDDPGNRDSPPSIHDPARGRHRVEAVGDPWRGRGRGFGYHFPGVFGASHLDHGL